MCQAVVMLTPENFQRSRACCLWQLLEEPPGRSQIKEGRPCKSCRNRHQLCTSQAFSLTANAVKCNVSTE